MTPAAAHRLIVALDADTLTGALRVARRLRGGVRCVKIGSVLFTAEGPAAIRRMRALGFDVFLDLKFHDIPSTVERSCRAAVRHRVAMLTVHASGQMAMLQAAARSVRAEAGRLRVRRPRVVGVTVLTSVEPDGSRRLRSRALTLATQAQRAGLDGVVCSVQEASLVRRRLGKSFVIVCPGIRPRGAQAGDQHRIAAPGEAIASGADFLVVGRPITQAADPREAACRMLDEMKGACVC